MAVVSELIRCESDGTISFGDYSLETKSKLDNVSHQGDLYKVKTFKEITKLERNGMFVYESVPGTAVHGFRSSEEDVSFIVEGTETSSITLELEPETDYKIHIDDIYVGKNKTNLGGKLSISVDLEPGREVKVDVRKAFD